MDPYRPSRHGLTPRPPPPPPPPVLGPLQREYLLNPITALAFFHTSFDGGLRTYLLAAEDNRIRICDVETGAVRGELRVFAAQSVHGMVVGGAAAAAATAENGGSDSSSSSSSTDQQRVLVWGGYSVAVLTAAAVEACIRGPEEEAAGARPAAAAAAVAVARAPDWILEGVLAPRGDGLALLTAHNELIEGRFAAARANGAAGGGVLVLGGVSSPSRPILYSGNLCWETPECVLVAAGTVFGEIVVWRYHAGSLSSSEGEPQQQQQQQQRCEVLHVFAGHEGSIFGVHISHVFEMATGERLRLLASCSDDRTVRVWDITDSRDLSRTTHDAYQKRILAVRETGFGDSIESTEEEETSARCLAVAMGHISRIWQVRFPRKQVLGSLSSKIELWSFGEDTTAQKWSLSLGAPESAEEGPTSKSAVDLPSRTRGQLKNEAIYANHNGKNLWSHAMAYDKTGQLQVVTGGSDGNISLIGNSERVAVQRTLDAVPPLPITATLESESAAVEAATKETTTNNGREVNSLEEKENVPATEKEGPPNPKPKTKKKPKVKKVKDDYFNRFAFTADGSLLGVTKAGRFFVGSPRPDDSWNEIFLPDEFSNSSSSYAVIKSSTRHDTVFVGAAGGDIFIYRGSETSKLSHLTKVHGKVSDILVLSNSVAGDLTCRSSHESQPLYLLVTVLGSESAALIKIEASDEGTRITQTGVTVDKGFIVTSAALYEGILALGSRNGLISVLEATADGSYEPRASVEAKINDCVTSITMLPPKAGSDGSTYFLATCRDGKYRIYNVARDHGTIGVAPIHEISPPFGPMIEGAWFSNNNAGTGADLILYGFRSTKFVVWNETQRRELAAVECGGGHRTFAFDPLPDHPDGFRLAWTQVSRLCYFSQTHAAHRTLKPGGHGREIKAVSASGSLVATAAEDTAIRIWSYDREKDESRRGRRRLRCLAVVESHTAGIQSLRWHGQSHLFSSAGNKEFFVWRVSRRLRDESAHHGGLAVRCEAAYPDRNEDVDLRIMDFDVHCLGSGGDDEEQQPHKKTFFISLALSNSTLLTYLYSEATGFRLVARGTYTGACVTQLRHLHVSDGPTVLLRTLTGATDGHIAVWEAELDVARATNATGPGAFNQPAPAVAEYAAVQVAKLHQSTIKSLDLLRLPQPRSTSSSSSSLLIPYVLVTGGDDNALGTMQILVRGDNSSSSPPPITIRARSIVRSAHAAAVTGLAILSSSSTATSPDESASEVTLSVATCSNDQRVRRWAITLASPDGKEDKAPPVRVVLTDNRYSAIADAGDLEALNVGDADGSGRGRFVVGGVGVEIWGVGEE